MEASSTAVPLSRPIEMPAWKTVASHVCATLIAVLFLASGIWKATDPFGWAAKVKAFMVPNELTLPLAIALGIGETLAGLLILVPRFRRWGAMLAGGLLLGFLGYVGLNYAALKGQDCTCFPPIHIFGLTINLLQRSVGPEFFIGDSVMLALAAVAGFWAKPARGFRSAAVILGALVVFSGVSYGIAYNNLNTVHPPDSIEVNGQPVSLQHGKFFLYFFNPECPHCTAALEYMGHLKFKSGVQMVAIPTYEVQWPLQELFNDVKFTPPGISHDLDKLTQVFKFEAPPYGVVLENGKVEGLVPDYDEYPGPEPGNTLRKLGVVE